MYQGEPGLPGSKGEIGPPGAVTYIPARQETQYMRPVSIYFLNNYLCKP